MAIYSFERKIVSRSQPAMGKNKTPGQQPSVVARAAYIAGEKLRDERIGKDFDYRGKQKGITDKGIELPAGALEWQADREKLWNGVEKTEKRKDSQLAFSYRITLPREFSLDQQTGLIRDWCKQWTDKGHICDWGLHNEKASDGGEQPHAHVLVTTRPVDADSASGFGKKPDTTGKFSKRGAVGSAGKDDLKAERKAWAEQCNAALDAGGFKERIDWRSLEEQGIKRLPQPKIGASANAMQKRGEVTRRGDRWKVVAAVNDGASWRRAEAALADTRTGGMNGYDADDGRRQEEESKILALKRKIPQQPPTIATRPWEQQLRQRQRDTEPER